MQLILLLDLLHSLSWTVCMAGMRRLLASSHVDHCIILSFTVRHRSNVISGLHACKIICILFPVVVNTIAASSDQFDVILYRHDEV